MATSDRTAFEHFLEASIVFGRSVTFALQKEFSGVPDFKLWYAQKQAEMASDSLFKFLLEKRNYILKEGPIAVPKTTSISIADTVILSDYVEAHVTRGKPWYRRSPKVLLQDVLTPIRGIMNRHRQKSRESRLRKRLEIHSESKTEERLHFEDEQWCDRAATDVISEYLHKLEKIVKEAENRFMLK